MKRILLCAALTGSLAALSQAAVQVDVVSPDGQNKMLFTVDNGVTYSVVRGDEVLVAPTPIGMALEGKGVLGKTTAAPAVSRFDVKQEVKTPVYKKAAINLVGKGVRLSFDNGRYALEAHAYNEGVAYRWVTDMSGKITVVEENAGLNFKEVPTGAVAYNNSPHKNDVLQNSWESLHNWMPVSSIDPKRLVYFPLAMQFKSGKVMAVTESDLRDYPGLNLRRPEDKTDSLVALMGRMPAKVEDTKRRRDILERQPYLVKTAGQRSFPWRVFMLADAFAPLIENDMVYALAEPADPSIDFSWVKPGKVAWEWWNDWGVYGVDFRAGCNTETYLYYIDFAAANGLEYVIMDEGWSVSLNIMEIAPRVDLQRIIDHANAKDVGIVLWCSWPQMVGRQEEVIGKYAKMGAKGFKIDFFDRDDAFVLQYMEETARVAAKYKMLVNYHGAFKPTGLQRKWPNIVNYEGVWGQEQTKWSGSNYDMVANDCTIAMTRMLAGPLDYTPGAMFNSAKGQFRVNYGNPMSQGTRMHQIAMMVVYEGYMQMLCDSPTAYLKNKECLDFMAKIPAVWDDTRCLSAEIAKNVVVARRTGKEWYIAGLTNWDRQTFKLPLDFLASGTYSAEIFKDGINADRNGMDYAREVKTVKSGETLEINCQPGGGFVIRLTPAKR